MYAVMTVCASWLPLSGIQQSPAPWQANSIPAQPSSSLPHMGTRLPSTPYVQAGRCSPARRRVQSLYRLPRYAVGGQLAREGAARVLPRAWCRWDSRGARHAGAGDGTASRIGRKGTDHHTICTDRVPASEPTIIQQPSPPLQRSGAYRVFTRKRVFLVKSSETPSVRSPTRTSICGRTVEEMMARPQESCGLHSLE